MVLMQITTKMWILDAVYSLFWNSLLDFVFFIIIDAFAKITLGDSRTPEEKKTIWFGESIILALTSVIIYFCDHTPVVLIFLTIITFVYTQSSGMVNVRNWYISLKTRWEEYQQHQDSVERMRIHLNNQQAYFRSEQVRQEAGQRLAPYNRNVPPFQMHQQQQQHGMYPVKNLQQSRMGFPSNTQSNLVSNQNFQPQNNVTQQTHNTSSFWSKLPRLRLPNAFKRSSPTTTATTGSDDDHYQLRKEEYSFSTEAPTNLRPNKQTPLGKVDYTPPIKPSWFGENLGRRPIRRGVYSGPDNSTSESYSLKNRFISAFGFSSTPESPPGLRNEGQNLCFMNSIIQCLARTPNLIQSLSRETSKESECTLEESLLLTSIVEILENCKVKGSAKVLDPIAFRQAASSLPNSVVAVPSQRQTQQDAAEFYMWFMDSLHCLLNKNRKSNGTKNSKSSERLKTLKFIYGDLNPAKLQDLKVACKQEIDQAHGLQNNSYAEPVQRLSDLEWLTYKAENNSVIDDSFTGQLVIGYHCLSDNRITVNMQTFNILPVPLVSPREVSGLVMLADCFATFCNVENLTGQDALDHNSWCPAAEKCSTPVRGPFTPSAPKVNGRKRGFSSADSAVGGLGSPLTGNPMSPIPGNGEFVNDSGFQDTVFKTSTPIAESQLSFIPQHQRLKDAQRRCLLRQLPECLVIQLMRFNYNPFTRQSSKVQAPVSIPLRDLDLTQIMFDTVTNREDLSAPEHSHKYDLYGVCVHIGADTTSYGHYISYCLQPDNNTWYKFDDEDVTEVNMEYELTMRELRENAYILFYKKAASSPSLS